MCQRVPRCGQHWLLWHHIRDAIPKMSWCIPRLGRPRDYTHVTSHNSDHSITHTEHLTKWRHAQLWTLNIDLWTLKRNSEPNCNKLWPWPLHWDFPSAPICFLLSYCPCCSHSCICSVTPVPLTLLSCTCSILTASIPFLKSVSKHSPHMSTHIKSVDPNHEDQDCCRRTSFLM